MIGYSALHWLVNYQRWKRTGRLSIVADALGGRSHADDAVRHADANHSNVHRQITVKKSSLSPNVLALSLRFRSSLKPLLTSYSMR